MNDTKLTMMMPKELYDKLKNEAKKKNISMSSLIRLICTEYLEKNSQKNSK